MKRKFVWLVVSCLMLVTLLLPSCGSAEEEEVEVETPEGEEVSTGVVEQVVREEEEEEVGAPEKPKYGGQFTVAFSSDVRGFDECYTENWFTYTLNLTNDELFTGNWAKDPAAVVRLAGSSRLCSALIWNYPVSPKATKFPMRRPSSTTSARESTSTIRNR